MNNTKYNIDNVKLKYILGVYKDLPDYPNADDIIYLMVKRASDKGESMQDITFTTTKLLKRIGEIDVDKLNAALANSVKDSKMELIRESKDSQTYKIIENPYI